MTIPTTITVSNQKTGDTYLSRSFPDDDKDNNGLIELYRTPVYYVHLSARHRGGTKSETWKALRFMPYWNDPKSPSKKYKSRGFINAGLHALSKRPVPSFNPRYGVQNRYSPYAGAFRMRDSFLIHAGPKTLSDRGWGSAGCVEIIGDFDQFKESIVNLSRSRSSTVHDPLLELVRRKRLFIEVERAKPPKFLRRFERQE